MKKLLTQIITNLKNEDVRTYRLCTYGILGVVSLIMTVMNVITNKGYLTAATAVFAMLSFLDIILTVIGERGAETAKYLFSAEFIALFTFFLISGNPDGFSVIWIVLLPMAGMFFFGITLGSIVCRWGGEEFVVICPNGDVSLGDLHTLKDNVSNAVYPFSRDGRVLTISIGVYEADYTAHSQIDAFINNADFALYNAKENGRDRIEYYDPTAPKKDKTAPKGTAK